MIRKADVRQTARGEGRKSLQKAEEYGASAADAILASRWDSAALAAVHSAICAADAALIASAGIRSVSQDHAAVLGSLEDYVPEFTAAQRRQLNGVLQLKNTVAYEQRLVTEAEARQLADQAGRLLRWARTVAESHAA